MSDFKKLGLIGPTPPAQELLNGDIKQENGAGDGDCWISL